LAGPVDFVVDIKITLLIMSLIQHSLFCDRAKGAFLILMPQVGLDSQIVEPDTSNLAGLPAVALVFLKTSIVA
jgi:hypothetical protein